MTETNRIIAQFMGVELHTPKNPKYTPYYRFYHESGLIKSEVSPEHLAYHSSWGWLMPVVEKIEALGYSVAINKLNCYIFNNGRGNRKYDATTTGDTKISAVYTAVVAFINWYQNKNNENN